MAMMSTLVGHRLAAARRVLDIEIEAIQAVSQQLDQPFEQAIDILLATQGRVIVTGMGKSGQVGKKMAATFSSTGSPAYFLHPAEGSHGDAGLMMAGDVVIAISNSGETPEILGILPIIKRLGLPLIAMTGKPGSTLAQIADILLDVAVPQEACPMNLAPTASTTATMALGDALAVVLLKEKGFSEDDFALVHPAGALGRRLLYRVQDLMHTDPLPIIQQDTPFLEALLEISDKRLGLALVVDNAGRLQGVLTDGDVRRALSTSQHSDPSAIVIHEVMTRQPRQISAQALAVEALHQMQTHKITALIITDGLDKPSGVLHLHDLLKAGIC